LASAFNPKHKDYSKIVPVDDFTLMFNGINHKDAVPPCLGRYEPPLCESRDFNNPSRHTVIGWNILRGVQDIILADGSTMKAKDLIKRAPDVLYLKCAILSFLHYAIGDFVGTFDTNKVTTESDEDPVTKIKTFVSIDPAKIVDASNGVFKNYFTAMGEAFDATTTYTYKQMVEMLAKKTVNDYLVKKGEAPKATQEEIDGFLGWNAEKIAVGAWLLGISDPVSLGYVGFLDGRPLKTILSHGFLHAKSTCHSAFVDCTKNGADSIYSADTCETFTNPAKNINAWVKADHVRVKRQCRAVNEMMKSVRADKEFFDCATFPDKVQPTESLID